MRERSTYQKNTGLEIADNKWLQPTTIPLREMSAAEPSR